jgi:hypothetical protein
LSFSKTNAQVISTFKQLLNAKADTCINLQYFKNADSILLNKIDSFDLFLTETKYELDSNYFYLVQFTKIRNKIEIGISYCSQYNEYLMITNSLGFGKLNRKRKVFAFFFYKNKLILCSTQLSNINYKDGSKQLLKNLIYENVNESEKAFILHLPNEIRVEGKPAKQYYLE